MTITPVPLKKMPHRKVLLLLPFLLHVNLVLFTAFISKQNWGKREKIRPVFCFCFLLLHTEEEKGRRKTALLALLAAACGNNATIAAAAAAAMPNHQRWYAKWKLGWNICSIRIARLALICKLSRWLVSKISASELSRKFIKSALLVGCAFTHFSPPPPPLPLPPLKEIKRKLPGSKEGNVVHELQRTSAV